MKDFKSKVTFVCGVISGILIGGISIVCANQAIQAIQNTNISVSLNDHIYTFKDETTGETQYPITYNNRTYLPLRNVAQLAGLDVDYDQTNNIAQLSSKDGGVYDEEMGVTFKRILVSQWHQVAGVDIYSYTAVKDGYKIYKVSVPLGEPDYMKKEFGVQYEYKELFLDKSSDIVGIAGVYKTDDNNPENSPYLESILIKHRDNIYTKLDPELGTTNENIEKNSKIEDTKDYVINQFSEKTDDYSYDIPFVNLDSIDAQSINNDIEIEYLNKALVELNEYAEGLSISMYKVEYEYYINGDILSLVVSKEFPNDCIYYKTYNLNLSTGKKVSNKELLELKKISEDDYLNKMKDTVTKFVEEHYSDLKKEFYGSKDEVLSYVFVLEKTLERCSTDLPMFLDKNGDVSFVIDVTSIAGAEAYSYTMKI